MKQTALAATAIQLPVLAQQGGVSRQASKEVFDKATGAKLRWLEGEAPNFPGGVTWGVAWPRGDYKADQQFALQDEKGREVPLQSWPLAFWPDGSLKWTAHAALPTGSAVFQLVPAKKGGTKGSGDSIAVVETDTQVEISTGIIICKIPKSGANILDSIEREGKIIARDAQLVCLLQSVPETPQDGVTLQQKCLSRIGKTLVEQSGPLRAVVRVEGFHRTSSGRQWLPFTIRFYFYAGSDAVRVVHTIIFDGDENKDFIRGLGLTFTVPQRDALHDRHVRFAGQDNGLWAEAVRGLTGLRREPGKEARQAQIDGLPTPPVAQWATTVSSRLELIPAWGDFTLSQLSDEGYTIRKRTKEGHGWIPAGAGKRAAGTAYIGGISGGVAFGLRDFWQKYPAQLDIRGAHTDAAQVTLWLYSPDAQPMDLRFYHDGLGMETFAAQREGLEITYEDYEQGFGTPLGVARTSELTLWAVGATPSREKLVDFAAAVSKPPLLVASPQHLLNAGVFGALWSLPDRSTSAKNQIENQLDFLFDFYQTQVEEQHWYGFWDYGDVMHSYDGDRHVWRYDVGGFAWDNAELSPELWLWYAFLRSGRADVFRFAEAMTRHTGEVDVHHIGKFAGLGSRHNVQHWGDSSKQTRISNAAYKRFFFFLTADERTGDLLRELLDSDIAVAKIDVGRKLGVNPDARRDDTNKPLNLSLGTSWCSVVAAWLTEWERTGNTVYRDKIVAGMQSIGEMPRGWLAGGGDYDVKTGRLTNNGDAINLSHLNAVFGAVEINAEIIQLLDVPEYKKVWLQYCELYNASADEQKKQVGQAFKKLNLREAHSRLTAYVAQQKNDPALAARAWREFYEGGAGLGVHRDLSVRKVEGPDVLNPISESFGASTNATSQWGLAAIQNLALIGDELPADGLTLRSSNANSAAE